MAPDPEIIITFYANGGVFPSTGKDFYVTSGSYNMGFPLDLLNLETPIYAGYVLEGWSSTLNGPIVTSDGALNEIANTCEGYAVWKVDDSHDKCIFEKGAIDIIVDKIKAKDGYVDTSNDTVTADVLLEGYTAHDAAGNLVTGTSKSGPTIVEGTITSHCSGKYHYGDISLSKEPKILVFRMPHRSYIQAIYFSNATFPLSYFLSGNRILGFYMVENSSDDGYSYAIVSPNDHTDGSGIYTNLPLFKHYGKAPDASPSTFKYTAYYWD